MADLEKKISQKDLIQLILEARERGNTERVDMLVGNAIKQLKISRFKPDQAIILSLTYLAKTKPDLFTNSVAIGEALKSLLRRESGLVLPVFAANILLAACDSSETRAIIIEKIQQWLGSSQKMTDTIQHLLATICIKSGGDQNTMTSLMDIRQHWLQYLDENHKSYGIVPPDLCSKIRGLLYAETNCDTLVEYLEFLLRHDPNILTFADEVSEFIVKRPLSIQNMIARSSSFAKCLLKIYAKLFEHQADKQAETASTISNPLYVMRADVSSPLILSKDTIEAFLLLWSLTKELNAGCENALEQIVSYWMVKGDDKTIAKIYEDMDAKQIHALPVHLMRRLIFSNNDALIELALRDATVDQLVVMVQTFGCSHDALARIIEKLIAQDVELIRGAIEDASFFEQLIEFLNNEGISGAAALQKRLVQPV